MKHAQHQIPEDRLREFGKQGTAGRGFGAGDEAVGVFVDEGIPAGEEASVVLVGVGVVGGGPRVAFVNHAHEDDGAGPDVRGSGVVGAF